MSTLLRRLFAGLMPAAAFVAIVLGCSGDSSDDSGTLVATRPAAPERYAVGQLGFVKPTFARRYLVQAYRVMNGLPAVRSGAYPQPYDAGLPGDLFDRWRALLDRVLGPAPAGDRSRTPETERHGSDYSWFLNCGTRRTSLRSGL